MITKKTWLFITRAQPGLHAGQIDGIRQGIEQGMTKIIIWVGSANKEFTVENPFTYEERKHMIELSIQERLPDVEVSIFPVPDLWDNQARKTYILTNLPEFQYVVSGNIWTQEIFKESDKIIIPLEVRNPAKWTTIRWQIAGKNTAELEKVLPWSVIKYLEEINAFERLKEIFSTERKTPSLVVDMVILDENSKLILINRKNFPLWLALPGGFNEYWETWSGAAIREVREETGLLTEIEKDLWVRDDPNRDPRAHNVSRAFKGKIVGGKLKAGDDADKIVKIDIKDLNQVNRAFPDHKDMVLAALQ